MQYSFQSRAHWRKIIKLSQFIKASKGIFGIQVLHVQSDLSDRVHIRPIYISDLQRKPNS